MSSERGIHLRAIRGGFWVFTLRMSQQVLGLVRLVILARLLAPSDFGLMGIALLTMSAIDVLTQTGFELALIQKKEKAEEYLDSAWTVGIIRGFALFLIIQALAGPAARFFNVPQGEILIRVIALSPLLRALTNIGTIYFQKELEFNKQFTLQFGSRLADFTVAVVGALILRNVWVLILAFLAGDLVRCVVSYLIHPYKPRLRMDSTRVRELFGFGKWILGSGIVVFLLNEADKAFIGRFIGATMLGFYQIANRISNMPATEYAQVISQVTIPAYSKLQDRMAQIRDGYLRVLQLTGFLAVPLSGAILIFAGDLTRLFLGEKWMPAVGAMQVLAVWGAMRAVISTTGPVFVGIGKPKLETKYQSIRLCLLAALIYPLGIRFGIVGTGLAVLLSGIATAPLFMRCVTSITGCRRRDIARLLAVPAGFTALSAVVTLLAARPLESVDIPALVFGLKVAIYGTVYLGATHLAGKHLGYSVEPLVAEIVRGLRT